MKKEEKTIFDKFGIGYRQHGDVLIPDFDIVPEHFETVYTNAGRYGRMWLAFMKENDYDRFVNIGRRCELAETAMRVEDEAQDILEAITKSHLKKHEFKDRFSSMERWRVYDEARRMAEEIVLNEVVFRKR